MGRTCAIIGLAIVTAAVAVAGRSDPPDLKVEVQAIYDHIAKSVEKKDLDGVTKFSLPDATVRFADDKELTLKEFKERAAKGWGSIKQVKLAIKVADVKADGETAVATYTETHDAVVLDPADGREHKIGYEGKWRSTLKKTPDGWRLSKSAELERRVTRDGKLIDQVPADKPKP